MHRRAFLGTLTGGLLAGPLATFAQPAERTYQIGVVLEGGPYVAALDGLRSGLQALGLEEGRHFVLHVHDVKGDPSAVGPAARALERQKVDLIYAVTTSVTLATRQATTRVPIVFYAGSDPVDAGLVQSFRKPGGRLTGVYSRTVDLTPKRFELLKVMLPRLRRVVTFYRRDNAIAVRSVEAMREVARELKVELLERPVASFDELRASLRALKPGVADAYLQAGDATIVSQTDLILETARAKRLPTMFSDETSVVRGGLASYGMNYRTASQHAAAYVRRVLLGATSGDLPVEQLDEPYTVINLRTAKALDLKIPPPLLQRADRVIE
ncbi:MAG TPA: ABC transporter substrate-binding protein [Methylomirabilota bacterium]|jgi:putative ABC transport system substrate-binding protein